MHENVSYDFKNFPENFPKNNKNYILTFNSNVFITAWLLPINTSKDYMPRFLAHIILYPKTKSGLKFYS